jgi:hypothetical protein
MVDVSTKFPNAAEQIKQRVGRVKVPAARPGIMVEPADDDMRRLLKHPRGIKFRSEGPIEWPDDQFTHRRIADGSVKVVEQETTDEREQPESHRRQSRRHEQE